MKLNRLKIENYSRLQDLELEIRDHLVMVGANDVGKSSLLRAIDLTLGASVARLHANITTDDFENASEPLLIEVEFTHLSPDDTAPFPDEIHIDPTTHSKSLTIQLWAEVDENESLSIQRIAPHGGTGRQISREQLATLGWKFLSATTQARDLREDRRSPVDDMLQAIELGDEKQDFDLITEKFQQQLNSSRLLKDLRDQLAGQLSKALPEKIAVDDLAFVSGAAADEHALSDVRMQVADGATQRNLSQQSDGTRALYAIALYDLMNMGSNVVGIDEPEIHLHPTSQRSLARLLQQSTSQKILATHSSDIVGAFDPDSIVVTRGRGQIVQPQAGFMSGNDKTFVRWWVRDRLEPLTSSRVIAVEGISDRIIVQSAAELTGRNLDRLGVSVIEAGSGNEMAPINKLFGPDGFNIPLSILIDKDAQESTAEEIGVAVADLPARSVWTSHVDLEDEYVAALGPEAVWGACKRSGQFKPNQLKAAEPSHGGVTPSAADVAAFCRRNSNFKVRAALSVASVMTEDAARKITSVDSLLNEIAS